MRCVLRRNIEAGELCPGGSARTYRPNWSGWNPRRPHRADRTHWPHGSDWTYGCDRRGRCDGRHRSLRTFRTKRPFRPFGVCWRDWSSRCDWTGRADWADGTNGTARSYWRNRRDWGYGCNRRNWPHAIPERGRPAVFRLSMGFVANVRQRRHDGGEQQRPHPLTGCCKDSHGCAEGVLRGGDVC